MLAPVVSYNWHTLQLLGIFNWEVLQLAEPPLKIPPLVPRLSPSLVNTCMSCHYIPSINNTREPMLGVGTSPQSQLAPLTHAVAWSRPPFPFTHKCAGSSSLEGRGGAGSLQLLWISARAPRASKSRRACWMPKNILSTLRRSRSFCWVKPHRLGFSACRVGSTQDGGRGTTPYLHTKRQAKWYLHGNTEENYRIRYHYTRPTKTRLHHKCHSPAAPPSRIGQLPNNICTANTHGKETPNDRTPPQKK